MKRTDHFNVESQRYYDFTDANIRQAFIAKVYMILMFQLMLTFAMVSVFVFNEDAKRWAYVHPELVWVALAVTLVLMLALTCCEGVRRTTPMNYICLLVFTVAESFLAGVISSRYVPEMVLMAIGITAVVCFALSVFAMVTSVDFTVMGGAMLALGIILLLFGLITMFFPSKMMMTIYCSCGVFIFALYLIYDTQMLVGGNHQYEISPEDYVFAALTIYLDVINMFLMILGLLGLGDD